MWSHLCFLIVLALVVEFSAAALEILGVPAFRDFTICDPHYFVIIFKLSISWIPHYFMILKKESKKKNFNLEVRLNLAVHIIQFQFLLFLAPDIGKGLLWKLNQRNLLLNCSWKLQNPGHIFILISALQIVVTLEKIIVTESYSKHVIG